MLRVAISGALVGSLYALNAWDFPTFLLLAAVGVWVGRARRVSRAWKPMSVLLVGRRHRGLVAVSRHLRPSDPGAAPELPSLHRKAPVVSSLIAAVDLHRGERTSLIEYLTIFGVPYAFGIALVASRGIVRSQRVRHEPRSRLRSEPS